MSIATSWRAPRSGGRRAPKGLEPFGNPQCVFVGATLPLRATRRKSLHLQILRARLKESRAHLKAKALAFSTCRSWWLNWRHSIKSVYVISLVSFCRAAKEQFPKAAAFGSFSFAISLWNEKEMASMPVQRTRAAV